MPALVGCMYIVHAVICVSGSKCIECAEQHMQHASIDIACRQRHTMIVSRANIRIFWQNCIFNCIANVLQFTQSCVFLYFVGANIATFAFCFCALLFWWQQTLTHCSAPTDDHLFHRPSITSIKHETYLRSCHTIFNIVIS